MRPIIQSRAEFDDCIVEAIPKVKQLITDVGADPVLVSVLRQLEAIKEWTADGQNLSRDQDKRITMGLQALRQMADFPDEQDLIVTIDNYIKTVMVPYDPYS